MIREIRALYRLYLLEQAFDEICIWVAVRKMLNKYQTKQNTKVIGW